MSFYFFKCFFVTCKSKHISVLVYVHILFSLVVHYGIKVMLTLRAMAEMVSG